VGLVELVSGKALVAMLGRSIDLWLASRQLVTPPTTEIVEDLLLSLTTSEHLFSTQSIRPAYVLRFSIPFTFLRPAVFQYSPSYISLLCISGTS
jgi:hypothetical protein